MLAEGGVMDESEFNAVAETELNRLERVLENCGIEMDVDAKPGGILEVEFEDGSKVVINRHSAAREIWVAARLGGFHFRFSEGQWVSTRTGESLYQCLSRVVSDQSGESVMLHTEM